MTVPKGNQPQLIFRGVIGIDPGTAALLSVGTPYDFCFAIFDEFYNKWNDRSNQHLCHSEVARWV
jgi:hypothetical protein